MYYLFFLPHSWTLAGAVARAGRWDVDEAGLPGDEVELRIFSNGASTAAGSC